ncbi:MAG: hypothetical protein RLY23_1442 [Actinomycetota bacterium]
MSRRPFLTRFTAPLASMLLVASATGGVLTTTAVPAAAAVSAGGFVGVTPNRLLDTRNFVEGPCVQVYVTSLLQAGQRQCLRVRVLSH